MKTIKIIFFTFALLIIISLNVHSTENWQKKIKVVVLNFDAKGGLNQNIADAVEENLTTSLIESDVFEVIEKKQFNRETKELKLESSDDFNDNTRNQLGKLYGAEMIILGSVTIIGNNITINIRGIDAETGIAKFAKNLSTDSENNIPDLIPQLVNIITNTKKLDVKTIEQNNTEESENESNNENSQIVEDKKSKLENDSKDKKVKEKEIDKNKILIGELESSDDESETFKLDDVEGLEDYAFKEIIIESEQNSVEVNYLKIWFDDWDDDYTLEKEVVIGENGVNNFSIKTLNKKGAARIIEKIKIKFEVMDNDNDENAIVKIYGVK